MPTAPMQEGCIDRAAAAAEASVMQERPYESKTKTIPKWDWGLVLTDNSLGLHPPASVVERQPAILALAWGTGYSLDDD